MSILKEFKEFALRGNVVDMAVGIVIGAGFGAIVNSLVKDIVMPPFALLSGSGHITNLFLNLEPHKTLPNGLPVTTLAQAEQAKAAVIAYGSFIMAVINFCIVAASIFLLIKGMNTLRRRLELLPPAPVLPPEPTPQEKLLMEIRDLLKKERR
jgi:large conductance mechanosensitive channel